MTRKELESVHDALTDLAAANNRAADDRGVGLAFTLTLYDDGSGRIGQRQGNEVQDWYDFDDFDRLVKALGDAGVRLDG